MNLALLIVFTAHPGHRGVCDTDENCGCARNCLPASQALRGGSASCTHRRPNMFDLASSGRALR